MHGIEQIRRFNRTIAQHLGVLDTKFLGRERPIGASRVLFEIGSQGLEVRALRARLELDSGYASRLVRMLEKEGLVRVIPSPDDARVRFLTLTQKGLDELALLNRLSDEAAASLLEPLSDEQKAGLITCMNEVEKVLRASATELELQHPTGQAAQECLTHYYHELSERFGAVFNPAKSISANPDELTPPNGYFLVARLYGEAVGCGALKCRANSGEIKRMWVSPSARGLGLGRRILLRLEELARQHDLRVLRLETNQTLVEAQGLYRSCGYREVAPFSREPYAHFWFEKVL